MRILLTATLVAGLILTTSTSGADPPNNTAIEIKLPEGWSFTIPNRQFINTGATITKKGGGTFPIASGDNNVVFAISKGKLIMVASPKAKTFGFGAGNNKLTYTIDGGDEQTDKDIRVDFDFKKTVIVELK